MQKAGVQPVLLPGAVYALGSQKYPDGARDDRCGARSCDRDGLQSGIVADAIDADDVSLAATQMKMTPAEAITAATINAAYSLGLGGEIGSLEAGKRADFVIHDCADHRELAYFFGIEPAHEVYIDGRRVYSKRAA